MTRDMAMLILGLPPGASADDVKAAFKLKASQWHPDKHGGAASKNEVMAKLNDARRILLEGGAGGTKSSSKTEEADDDDESPPFPLDLNEVLEFIRSKDGEKFCRAYKANGDPCSAKAKKGNYGFCYRHR
jgi:hypothetical protein